MTKSKNSQKIDVLVDASKIADVVMELRNTIRAPMLYVASIAIACNEGITYYLSVKKDIRDKHDYKFKRCIVIKREK